MRQQQQRSRNRNRGRKSTNPLSKNFESNGPDVKIRGNANHIAEKYSVLARDAQTSGDTVMAENYFQHAEHYFRIVAIAQQNNPQANTPNNVQNNVSGNRPAGEGARNAPKNKSGDNKGDGPQPELNEVPAEVTLKPENATPIQTQSTQPDDNSDNDDGSRNRRNGRRPASNRRTSRVSTKKDDASTDVKSGKSAGNLSKDGASLPSGLVGKPEVGENTSGASEE